jgi:calcineurin-like phosphoesterase family protein
MNRTLVRRYNEMVGPDDTVLWLGDCFLYGSPSTYRDILAELAGHKLLIVGNHDLGDTTMAAVGFTLVMQEAVMHIGGVPCRVNHYPYRGIPGRDGSDKFTTKRPRKHVGEILIHGHNHTKTPISGPTSINVGVDAWDFGPAPYEDVEDLVVKLQRKQEACNGA